MDKQRYCSLSWDIQSPALGEACQSHFWRAPGYITPASLTSPLRSYFSNVQSSLWLLWLPSPNSAYRHSASKAMFQEHSATPPAKSSQKPRWALSHSWVTDWVLWTVLPTVPDLCLLSPVLPGAGHLKRGLSVILQQLGYKGMHGWQPPPAWISPPSHIPS